MKKFLIPAAITASLISPVGISAVGQDQSISLDDSGTAARNTEEYWTPERLQGAKPLDLPTATAPADAQLVERPLDQSISLDNPGTAARNTEEYWTPERLQGAKPLDLPTATAPADAQLVERPIYEESISQLGREPTVDISPDNTLLFEPIDIEVPIEDAASESIPYSVGTDRAYFTSSRVTPAPAAQNSYPFRATGKLFFSKNNKDYICSASVIRPRVVITAGHCVYNAVDRTWHTNLAFHPAHHNGSTPYGIWYPSWIIVTSSWAYGGGGVPNRGDFAIMEMYDSNSKRIGDVTGYYGWRTYALNPNHVTILGYPGSFDNGRWMHRVDSQSFRATASNTVDYGSDMTGGSSGGPWLENFGETSTGQSLSPSGTNYVIGVTSYGPSTDYIGKRYQGSSVLDSQFSDNSKNGILDKACQRKSGNC